MIKICLSFVPFSLSLSSSSGHIVSFVAKWIIWRIFLVTLSIINWICNTNVATREAMRHISPRGISLCVCAKWDHLTNGHGSIDSSRFVPGENRVIKKARERERERRGKSLVKYESSQCREFGHRGERKLKLKSARRVQVCIRVLYFINVTVTLNDSDRVYERVARARYISSWERGKKS